MTSRTKAIFSLSGVFLLGAVCGALILGIVVRDRVQQAQRLRDPEGFEQYIVDRLKLTEAQRDSIKDELERTYAELAGLRHSTADEYRELLDTLKARIAPQLTPEQREMLSEMNLRFRSSFPKGMRPPPPPLRDRVPLAGPEDMLDALPGPGDTLPIATTTKPPVHKPSAPKELKEKVSPKSAVDSSKSSSPSVALSPDSDDNSPIPPKFAATLRDSLDLNDAQYQQVLGIITETRSRVLRVRSELADDPRMMHMATKRNLREMHMRIADVMTAEQLPRYRALIRDIVGRLRKERKNRHESQ